ncbi:MAG: class I SAM-dependent methyltransferase [Chloroflexota bacterium]
MPTLLESYDDYERIEEAFLARLDESLNPRGPDFFYEVMAGLGLPEGASALDVGCGAGKQSLELARRFGFSVLGIDPVPSHVDESSARRDEAAQSDARLRDLLRFEAGTAQAISLPDASVDLVLCREVLVLVDAIEQAFAECRRVLKPGGRMLIYQIFPTERLESSDEALLAGMSGPKAAGSDRARFEEAFATAGLVAEQRIELASEGGEYFEEQSGEGSRRLLHAARLLRAPDRYVAEFGQQAYEIMLGDAMWHVFRMIGKQSAWVYVLRAG